MAKAIAQEKSNKKEIRHKLEAALNALMEEMLKGKPVSKHLHKKIKKAGKLLAEGLADSKEFVEKTTKPKPPASKAAPKKITPKKIAKKAPGKKAAKK